MKIIIAEDNKILSNNIKIFLESEGNIVHQIFDGGKVYSKIMDEKYDILILDLGLPNIDGISIIHNIRRYNNDLPILILTARDSLDDKLIGLDSGADDYLTKPFEYDELLARLKLLIRRKYTKKSNIIKIGKIELDINNKRCIMDNNEVLLSKLEFNLLSYLFRNHGKIISKIELYEQVWGEYDNYNIGKTVDIYIGYLRKKLYKNLIETVRGEGYIIK